MPPQRRRTGRNLFFANRSPKPKYTRNCMQKIRSILPVPSLRNVRLQTYTEFTLVPELRELWNCGRRSLRRPLGGVHFRLFVGDRLFSKNWTRQPSDRDKPCIVAT